MFFIIIYFINFCDKHKEEWIQTLYLIKHQMYKIQHVLERTFKIFNLLYLINRISSIFKVFDTFQLNFLSNDSPFT